MSSIGKEFMEKTKFQYLDRSDQSRNIPQPELEAEYDASRPVIDLPRLENIKIRSFDLRHAIEGRRSIRSYSTCKSAILVTMFEATGSRTV